MNPFWQITIIEFLLNVAVFAGAIIFYGPIRLLAARLLWSRKPAEKLAAGVLFGGATAATLFLPIHLEGGAAAGCGTILLTLAGPLEGAMAIVTGALLALAIELLPKIAHSQPDPIPISFLLVSAVLGFSFQYVFAYDPGQRKRQFTYIHLPFLGVLSAVGSLLVTWLFHGIGAVVSSTVAALVSNVLATVILGTLLLHEKYRSEAEHYLRESEAHLATQAKELAVARDTAETANRAKSAFLANMSHELRTPLNAILGYAQLLRRDGSLNTWQTNACTTIQQSGEHLLTLITDILDLSKIEAGKLELQPGVVELKGFLQGIANIIRVKTDEKGLEFRLDISPDIPSFVQVDEKRLRQVLLNLLSNAVKFTDQGSVTLQVRITAGSQPRLHFAVSDTGVGIAHDQLEKIFQPFEQVGDTEHRSGGTGLGLSISRQLVQLMAAEIRAESVLGSGSRFWFDVVALVMEAESTATQVGTRIIGYEGRRRRVLVVDDITPNRSLLIDTLSGLGFEISEAGNGLEAVEKAQTDLPDLVLMDIRMPVMDGLEATHRIGELPELRQLPVILMSAGGSKKDQASSTTTGARAFLAKPIENERLLQEIGKCLDLRWTFDRPQELPPPDPNTVDRFVVPEPAEMEVLRELARTGNMRSIREHADRLAALDPQYRPFADRMRQLAQSYQSKTLLSLVEKYTRQEQVVE